MKRGITIVLLMLIAAVLHGQSRKLPSVINKTAVNITAPAISADGNRMIYMSDYTASGDLSMMMTEFKGGWQEPLELPTTFNQPKLNFAFGHYLNFDGSRLYFTSRRSGSKKYDIWYTDFKNGSWVRPVNMGVEINSTENEGAPSFTPDEREMYFCRCSNMLNYNASGCNIFYSKKENNKWSEPIQLPASINEGNVMAPRIMSDGVTLIYASNKPGGKGKFDLYMSKKDDEGNWSSPQPLDYVNTPEDDMISTSRLYGARLLISKKEGKFDQLYEYLIPDGYKPEKILFLNYELIRDNNTRPAIFTLQDWETGDVILTSPIDSGRHNLVMKEGKQYHLQIQPVNLQRAPVSRIFDVRELERSTFSNESFELTAVKPGRQVDLEGAQIADHEPYFPERSSQLIDHTIRMARFLEEEIEMQIVQTNYMQDTIFVNEDMTEIRWDTTYMDVIDTIWLEPDTLTLDLMADSTVDNDSISSMVVQEDLNQGDSVQLVLSLDSTGVVAEIYQDTLAQLAPFEIQISSVAIITKYYHNDRFEKESAELRERMAMMGVPEERIKIVSVKEDSTDDKPDRFLRIQVK